MTALAYTLLDAPLWPLMNKFYRSHDTAMRSSREGVSWVAKEAQIVAALNLRPMAQGHWLTGLFVDPAYRGRQIASGLVAQAIAPLDGPVWLFCHPDLQGFYEKLGFCSQCALPQALAERLARYRRNKALVALQATPACRAAGPGTSRQ